MVDLELAKSEKLRQMRYVCRGCKELVDRTEILDYLNQVNNPDLEPLLISEPTWQSLSHWRYGRDIISTGPVRNGIA